MRKPTTFENIIVGGGLAGLSCAYWLIKNGNKSVALINNGTIISSNGDNHLSDALSGSLSYLYKIYRKKGIDSVVEIISTFNENIDLVEKELNLVERESYVNLFKVGTINHFEEGSMKEIGFYQSFINELIKRNVKIREVKNPNFRYGVEFFHEADFETISFIRKIMEVIKDKVYVFEDQKCVSLMRDMDKVIVRTNLGDELAGKNVIFANSNTLATFLPELREKLIFADSYLLKYKTDKNIFGFSNYANQNKHQYHLKLSDGFYFAGHSDLDDEYSGIDESSVKTKFDNFCKTNALTSSELENIKVSKIAFSKDGHVLVGRSVKNPNLYYVGGFSGQSKLTAFKSGRDLVSLIYGPIKRAS